MRRAYLCCLFALSVVVSPLQVLVSAPLSFYLLQLTIHLHQSPHLSLSYSSTTPPHLACDDG